MALFIMEVRIVKKNEQELKLLSKDYQRIIIETEDTKEILAEITNKEIKSANNIQIRIMPTYD